MSMLAEVKTKKRKLVSMSVMEARMSWNSDKGFGNTLMQKLGWIKGNGLGKDEQGVIIPIRQKSQIGSLGVGAKEEDLAPQHFDKLENALAEINSKCSQKNGENDEIKDFIHTSALACHKKIPKNVNKLPKKDLDCIFGIVDFSTSKKKKKESTPVVVEQPLDASSNCRFQTNPSNIQVYFKTKMRALKAQRQERIFADSTEGKDDFEFPDVNFDVEKTNFSFNVSCLNTPKVINKEQTESISEKKSKKKKKIISFPTQMQQNEEYCDFEDAPKKTFLAENETFPQNISSNDLPRIVALSKHSGRNNKRKRNTRTNKKKSMENTEIGKEIERRKRTKSVENTDFSFNASCLNTPKVINKEKTEFFSEKKSNKQKKIKTSPTQMQLSEEHCDFEDAPKKTFLAENETFPQNISSNDLPPLVALSKHSGRNNKRKRNTRTNKKKSVENTEIGKELAENCKISCSSKQDALLDNQNNTNHEYESLPPKKKMKINLSDSYLMATGNSHKKRKLNGRKRKQMFLKNIFSSEDTVGATQESANNGTLSSDCSQSTQDDGKPSGLTAKNIVTLTAKKKFSKYQIRSRNIFK